VFAHFTQGSNNLQRSADFYDALLAPIGITRREDKVGDEIICYLSAKNDLPRFFVVAPFDNNAATVGNGSMIAFTADSQEQVDASYNGGINNGGTDEGAPGNRPQYTDGYYGAYLRDPDGNKVHIVYRGDLQK